MGVVEEAHNVRVIGPKNNTSINNIDGGGGGDEAAVVVETIVLAHGFGTDQSVWKHLVPHLIDEYRVVLYDNMGAGTTNPEFFDFDRYSNLQGYTYDLLAILDELGIERCIFIGHSLSSIVGMLASILRPDRFSKLILLAASPRFVNEVDYYGGFDQEDLDQLFEAMEGNYKAWCSGFAPLAVGGDLNSAAVQEFSRTLFNMRPDISLSVAQTVFQYDIRHHLGQVTVPCHIIQSVKDLAVPVFVSEYLRRSLVSCKSIVQVMPSEGHLPQLSSPDVVVPVLLEHIRNDIDDGV